MNSKILPCIDCGNQVSLLAKTCPHCGRPWPQDGKNGYVTSIKKYGVQFLKNFHVFIFIVFMGAFVGAGINSYKKYAVTGNYDEDAVINFLLYNFWNSLIIGLPTLILGISAALFVCMFGLITWKKITNSYIKVEYKIISIKAWPKQERSADDLSYFFEKERFEDKRRKIFRWILATPIILALLMAL